MSGTGPRGPARSAPAAPLDVAAPVTAPALSQRRGTDGSNRHHPRSQTFPLVTLLTCSRPPAPARKHSREAPAPRPGGPDADSGSAGGSGEPGTAQVRPRCGHEPAGQSCHGVARPRQARAPVRLRRALGARWGGLGPAPWRPGPSAHLGDGPATPRAALWGPWGLGSLWRSGRPPRPVWAQHSGAWTLGRNRSGPALTGVRSPCPPRWPSPPPHPGDPTPVRKVGCRRASLGCCPIPHGFSGWCLPQGRLPGGGVRGALRLGRRRGGGEGAR